MDYISRFIDGYTSAAKLLIAPMCKMLPALVFSWIYLITPSYNFWIYCFIKQQMWSSFGVACMTEFVMVSMPTLPKEHYLAVYLAGNILPPILRVVGYLTLVNDEVYNFFITVISVPALIVAIAVHIYSIGGKSDLPSESLSSATAGIRLSTVNKVDQSGSRISTESKQSSQLSDMYEACIVTSAVQGQTSDWSIGRSSWVEKHKNRQSVEMRESEMLASSTASPMRPPAQDDPDLVGVSVELSRKRAPWKESAVLGIPLARLLADSSPSSSEFDRATVTGDPIQHAFLVVSFLFTFIAYFFFLDFFARRVGMKSDANAGSSRAKALFFIIFVSGAAAIRSLLKRVGLAIDRSKSGTISLFFLAEFAGAMYFYTYYRLLFEDIHSWGIFFAFQVIHLTSEWILFPMRGWLLRVLPEFLHTVPEGRVQDFLRGFHSGLLPQGTNEDDWMHFLALDFGIRVVVMVVSSVCIVVLLWTIDLAPWVRGSMSSSVSREDTSQSTLLIFVALCFELVNALLIHALFFAPKNVNLALSTAQCFRDIRFIVVANIIGTNLFINPAYTWTKDHFHYNK